MGKSNRFKSLVAAGLLACSASVQAASYEFGSLLTGSSGYTAPDSFASDPFAVLDAEFSGSVWTFTLTVNNNLFSSFGDEAFIGGMKFDFDPDPASSLVSTFIASNVGGVASVSSTSGDCSGGSGCFDFGTRFGQGAGGRLSQNDYVTWSVANLSSDSTLANMHIHVQGIDGGYSAKYTPVMTLVPEPEVYAMLLAGLGLIGLSLRRRHMDE